MNVAKVSNVATSTIMNTHFFSTVLSIALHLHAKPGRRVLARGVSQKQEILGMWGSEARNTRNERRFHL